ncbi:MAG: C4-dicarboxylate ABC transporter permease [Gemmatimonadetes bacterium]|nr:MAG: C4-dicarboxylate ABC transporter permease [Gemmatimonadota bacterium]
MRELARRIDRFQERFGCGVSWLSLAMVLVVFGDVISRYAFRTTSGGVQELEWYLFGTLYLLAAGYTLLHDEHVRVDIMYSKLTPRRKAWLDFVLFWVFFFPSCLMVIYTAWPFVRTAWSVWEGSPDPGGLPLRWLLKSMIIAGFVLLVVQGISQTIKSFYTAMGWETR